MEVIYLDNNATTPLHPAVWDAMWPYLVEVHGNPASAHQMGRRGRQALENAREHIADLLGAFPDEVIFTSGATEANNLALFGLVHPQPGHVISSSTEHPSVAEPLLELQGRGFEIDVLPVDSQGVVHADSLPERLRPDTQLVTVMLANNETGTIQPIKELAGRLGEQTAFHCDAVQAVGKIRVDFHDLHLTALSISAHKFHGPKGIGALILRRRSKLRPLFRGGHQQQGLRPGTEPVALVVGMATALELACKELDAHRRHVLNLRRRLLDSLRSAVAPLVLNGVEEGGIPHTLNLSFPGCQADALLMNLDLAGVCCSTGSACSSGSLLPSPVLRAMGVADEVLHSAMRFSLSPLLSEAEIELAADRIISVVTRLRQT
jgi:cysteine desulfurase